MARPGSITTITSGCYLRVKGAVMLELLANILAMLKSAPSLTALDSIAFVDSLRHMAHLEAHRPAWEAHTPAKNQWIPFDPISIWMNRLSFRSSINEVRSKISISM